VNILHHLIIRKNDNVHMLEETCLILIFQESRAWEKKESNDCFIKILIG